MDLAHAPLSPAEGGTEENVQAGCPCVEGGEASWRQVGIHVSDSPGGWRKGDSEWGGQALVGGATLRPPQPGTRSSHDRGPRGGATLLLETHGGCAQVRMPRDTTQGHSPAGWSPGLAQA